MKRRDLFIQSGGLLLGAVASPLGAERTNPNALPLSHGDDLPIAGPVYFINQETIVRDEIIYAHVFNPAIVYVRTLNGWKQIEL